MLPGLLRLLLVLTTIGHATPARAPAPPAREVVPQLNGTVGPGFTIGLTDAGGQPVANIPAGSYALVVNDNSVIHNFHLLGPSGSGVDESTEIDTTGQQNWPVTLTDGTYTFRCDVHQTMTGTFTVGPQAPPTTGQTITVNPPSTTAGPPITTTTSTTTVPPTKQLALVASVAASGSVHLSTPGGSPVLRVRYGPLRLTVHDRSRHGDFRLTGPGVSKHTSTAFVGTSTWSVRLRAGASYRYLNDAHPKVVHRFATAPMR